jgi:hypothetical protein
MVEEREEDLVFLFAVYVAFECEGAEIWKGFP